jgi:hypothetical protein
MRLNDRGAARDKRSLPLALNATPYNLADRSSRRRRLGSSVQSTINLEAIVKELSRLPIPQDLAQ